MAQVLDAATDKGGLARHINVCPHVDTAINIPDEISFDDTTCSVADCQETECWFCLSTHKVLCGRYGNQHMLSHYEEDPTRCIAMGLNDLSFWCYRCNDYINHLSIKRVWDVYAIAHVARFGEQIPSGLLSKTTFKKPTVSPPLDSVLESVESDAIIDDEKKEEIPENASSIPMENESKVAESKTDHDPQHETSVEVIDGLLSSLKLDESSKLKPLKASHCKTALFYHEDCLRHKPGKNRSHVERPERCSRPFEMLKRYGLMPFLKAMTPREATEEELKGSHGASHVERTSSLENSGWFDSDTFYNEHSSRAAKLAAGATIDVMAGILEEEFENGFALVRPPGHHCEHNKAMGFCLFNNAVVAVNEIRRRGLCKKVLIVDWDVHHGNGTQNLFYDDEDVLYFSTHRYDNGFFYPGTGHAKETGNGFNVNVPLNVSTDEGHGDKQYLLIWKDILLPMTREFQPDIVLISAGFDACIGDPLGGMRITPPCYGLLTRLLLNECSKLAIVLEGGYNLDTMPRAICCCHYALLRGPTAQKDAFDVDEFYGEFKANIVDKENVADPEAFHYWFVQYGAELVDQDYTAYFRKNKGATTNFSKEDLEDLSIHGACKKSVKLVLPHHQKHWKFAAEKLKEYESDENEAEDEVGYVFGFDDWVDRNAFKIKKKVVDMSVFLIQIGTLKQDDKVEWINFVHEWNGKRLEHKDEFDRVWEWVADKLSVDTVDNSF